MNRRRQLLAIALGGALGATMRIALTQVFPVGDGMPWTTLAINVAGAFLLGIAATLTAGDDPLEGWRLPLVGTGFCGALTTFSGLCLESLELADRGSSGLAVQYLSLSLVAGIGAALVGVRIASRSTQAGAKQ